MNDDTNILVDKEKKLARYFETYTTEEVLKEVQEYIPCFDSYLGILRKLNEMKLPHPVINTLIYYILATNKQELVTYKLFVLADLCKKFNIKDARSAITFFKQYYHIVPT